MWLQTIRDDYTMTYATYVTAAPKRGGSIQVAGGSFNQIRVDETTLNGEAIMLAREQRIVAAYALSSGSKAQADLDAYVSSITSSVVMGDVDMDLAAFCISQAREVFATNVASDDKPKEDIFVMVDLAALART